MKVAFVILAFAAVTIARADEGYSSRVRDVIEQLRQEKNDAGTPCVRGASISYGGKNGAVYLLGPYVFSSATKEDVLLMIKDSSPVVRILGAKRVLSSVTPMFRPEIIDFLLKDDSLVLIGPLDDNDTERKMTVADVIQELKRNPHFLPLDFFPKSP